MWYKNIAEIFNRLSRVHECYRETTDNRQTTDGRTTTYSEREREFTFAKNAKLVDKRGVAQVMWPTFKFWHHLYISKMAKAGNLKLGAHIDYDECYSNKMLSYRRETALQGAL